ncbi:hypothetical protein ACLVWU_04790 [Bdellovibrio sp. HCB290]|uniref:hypothetical protein n=1 Tax=Bdellovibrio sp. HCB290 TaxID=3394356 RepID=UPI0039B40140
MKTVNTNLVLALVFAFTAISGTAQAASRPSTTILAKGAEAKAMYDSMDSRERTVYSAKSYGPVTKYKLQNLTNTSSNKLSEGEDGIVCEKYQAPEVIKEVGTDYLCALIKL